MATAVAFRVMLRVILPLILLPSAAAAIMVTAPLAMPFTRPEASTVAFFSSLLLHVTSFFLASDGSMAAVNCLVSPTARIRREDGGGGGLGDEFADGGAERDREGRRRGGGGGNCNRGDLFCGRSLFFLAGGYQKETEESVQQIFCGFFSFHVGFWFKGVVINCFSKINYAANYAHIHSHAMPARNFF